MMGSYRGLMVAVLVLFDIITILNSMYVCGKSECRRKFLVLFRSLFPFHTAIETATATTTSSLLLFYTFF